jgi:hypothetical protein
LQNCHWPGYSFDVDSEEPGSAIMSDDFTAHHVMARLHVLERAFERHREAARDRVGNTIAAEREQEDRLDVLEFNFSRLLLILQSVVEIARRKNLFTPDELAALSEELELVDGTADGGLAPFTVPGMRTAPPRTSFFAFLRDLEKAREPVDTDEFLQSLARRPDAGERSAGNGGNGSATNARTGSRPPPETS